MRLVYVEDSLTVQRQTALWLPDERHDVTVFDNAIDVSDLSAQVWGERLDRKAARKRLKTHVVNLRARLEQYEAIPARILSLRGYYYRWAPDELAGAGSDSPRSEMA